MRAARHCTIIGAALAAAAAVAVAQPAKPLPENELRELASAYQELQRSFVTKPDDQFLITSAIKGMLKGADPDSGEYMTAAEYAQFRAPSSGDRVAAGVEVWVKGGRFILSPLAGGAAGEAGIQFGDELRAIDGARTTDLDLSEIVRRLRGAPGTKVGLTVFRDQTLSVHTIAVERRNDERQDASVTRLPAGVALIRVPAFHRDTLYDLSVLLRDAWKEGAFQGVILDLRACPGGLLDHAVGIASIFLTGNETVVSMHGAAAESNFVYKASPPFYQRRPGPDPVAEVPPALRRLPLVVLVNESTASGAEIVAAALQEHRRGIVIGRQTFGRASIQTIRPLHLGAIRYTSAHWFTPHGKKLHGVGLRPDIQVDDPWSPSTIDAALAQLANQRSR